MKKSQWDLLYAKMIAMGRQDAHVQVGVLGDGRTESGESILEIAAIHEYGAPGAGIPKRSFIRFTVKQRKADINRVIIRMASQVLTKGLTIDSALNVIGEFTKSAIKQSIVNKLIKQDLKPATIKRKGSSTALVDTGQLLNAITHKVVG